MSEPTAFATPADLEARWHPLTQDETAKARQLLEDASDQLESLGVKTDQINASTLKRIVCAMVRRAMTADSEGVPDGVSQSQMTAGPFSQGFTWSNPDGSLYLTRSEKQQLGLAGQHAFHVQLGGS